MVNHITCDEEVERLFFVSAFRLLTCNGNLRDVSWGGCHGVPVTVVLGSSHSGKPAKINKYESLENSSDYSKIIVWFSIDSLKPLYLCVFLNFFRNYCFNINPITVSMILLPSCFWTWVDSTPMLWTWLEESREIATKMGLHLPPSLGLQSPSLHPLLFAIGIPEYPQKFLVGSLVNQLTKNGVCCGVLVVLVTKPSFPVFQFYIIISMK